MSDFDPADIAANLVARDRDGAAKVADEIHRRLGTDHPRAMLRRVVGLWNLSQQETAEIMGGVSRQAASQWLDGTRPIPNDRRARLADLAAATDLLQRHVKDERIPTVVRRAADDLDGATLMQLAGEGRTEELLDYLRGLFDYRQLHP